MKKPKPEVPESLVTRNVFLDTQVYRQLGHNPDNGLLQEFGKRVLEGGLVLHTSDITLAEIQRQLREFVGATGQALDAARNKLGRWRHRHPKLVPDDVPAFDVDAVATAAFEKMQNAIVREWGAIGHRAMEIAPIDIFKDYFARRPPFAASESKEFPDAFVLKALERWCIANDDKMYVVTMDGAMSTAAAATGVLIPVEKLADLLEAAVEIETPDILRRADHLFGLAEVLAELQQGIETEIEDLVPVYTGEMAEGEVTGHSLAGDIEIENYAVVAASARELSVLLEVTTPLNVELSYEDRSEASYDREDDVYFGAETGELEFEDERTIRVFARLGTERPFVRDLEILTREINVSEPYETYK